MLSMAWVRFSSCVETVSNSSSTAEQDQSRLSGRLASHPYSAGAGRGVPGRPHLCGSRWGRGGRPGRRGRAGGGAGRPRRRGRPSCSRGAGRSPDVCVSAPGNCGGGRGGPHTRSWWSVPEPTAWTLSPRPPRRQRPREPALPKHGWCVRPLLAVTEPLVTTKGSGC